MKLRLLSTCLKSTSLKELSTGLSTRVGYKVWRSNKTRKNRLHLKYGDQKNKIEQYIFFAENDIPALDFTTNSEIARYWWQDGAVVVGRKLTRASEGKGIVIFDPSDEFSTPPIHCPVYTLYKKKKKEFRIHVFKDKVVHVLEKRKKKGVVCDAKVRNTANGYVFCSDNVEEPEGLRELALKASKVTTSDFKGVDIGWNEKKQELFVIEVNSAPGITGTNIQRYVNAITN